MNLMQSQIRRIGIVLFSILILFALAALPDRQQAEVVAAQCPAIAVAPGSIPGAALGVAYSRTFTASGGQSPYTFSRSAGTLPAGLFLNSGGGLGGTPNTLGNYNFTIRATDANGCTGTRSYSILVVCPNITLNPNSLPGASLGVSYSQNLNASGGDAPYTYSIINGSIPPGMFFGSGGLIGGTPNTLGNYNFTIRATDSNGCTGTRSYSILVVCPAITLNPNSLPVATRGATYSQSFNATGGKSPYSYSITNGSIPPGMFFGSGGLIAGTPNTPGTYNFTVRATDDNGCTGSRAYSLTVDCPNFLIFPANIPGATIGVSYSQNFTTTGGQGPYTYSVASGSIPPGMLFGSGGLLGGTPNTTGTYNFTVRSTDANNCSDTRSYTINVSCPTITLNPGSLLGGTVGTLYLNTVTATGGQGPYEYFLFVGSLPPGLSLSSSGVLSGTPTTAGSYSFTIRARDANNCFGLRGYTIDVAPPCPAITLNPATLPNALGAVTYSQTILPSGGQSPYGFSIISGALPAGLSLSPTTGLISGTPTSNAGIASFTVRATDANGCTGQRAYTIQSTCATINIATDNINATAGSSFLQTIFAYGQSAPYTFSFAPPSAPSWLNLSSTGVVTGTPPAAGTYSFGVRATDASGCSETKTLTITAVCSIITINPINLPAGTVGAAFGQTFSATGGTAPYQFGTNASALPPGLTLNTNGTLSGTPTTAGNYNFIIRGNDAGGCFGERSYTLVISNQTCPTITINPASLPNGTTGAAYSQNLSASGGQSPYEYQVFTGTLPPGLTLSTAGLLSGTPTTAGSYGFTVRTRDANGCIGSHSYTITIFNQVCPAITINPAALSTFRIGNYFFTNLTASGGTVPYFFNIVAGALPPGVTLQTSGNLSGSPSMEGNYGFTVQATDANGCSGTRSYTMAVNNADCPIITVNPPSFPYGTVGVAYNQTFSATGGSSPYNFSLFSGSLPLGLSLSADGSLTGTPTANGRYVFQVGATDANGCNGTRAYTLVINIPVCPTITVNPTNSVLPSATVGVVYSQSFTGSGGVSPYKFSGTGTIPPGLAPTQNGNLAGTPTTPGSYTFTVIAEDANGCTGERSYTLIVNSAPCPTITVTPASLPTGTAGIAYNQTLSATGGATAYSFSHISGALPTGLSLASNGTMTGAPTTAGSYSFTVRATDANGCTGERSYTLVVNAPVCPAININQTGLPPAVVGMAYNQTLTATGGVSPYSFSISGGSFPAELTLNSTNGAILGVPATAGVHSFTVRATDNSGCIGERAFTLVVSANLVTSVSAASFIAGQPLAPESIVATFGANLASSIQIASTITLPTELGGVSLKVKDGAGVERLAPLFFVSSGQINHQMPPGMALGTAVLTVMNGANVVATGSVEITTVSPGLFSADASGRGLASAVALRVRQDGTQSFEPIARYDTGLNQFVAVPIDVSNPTDQVFLVFYGTGWKLRSALSEVSCSIGDTDSEVLYAGEVPGFVGYDQLNARLSPSLAGSGEVDVVVTIDGKIANTVRIAIR